MQFGEKIVVVRQTGRNLMAFYRGPALGATLVAAAGVSSLGGARMTATSPIIMTHSINEELVLSGVKWLQLDGHSFL
jgi:hypothetical protein